MLDELAFGRGLGCAVCLANSVLYGSVSENIYG